MDIEYTGRQTVVGKKLKTQSEAGLARIAKLVGRTASAHVFLTADKYRRIAEVTLKTRKQSMVAACEADEMESALHDALAKLEKQAIRHHQKKTAEKRHPKVAAKDAELQAEPGMPLKAVLKKASVKSVAAKNGNGRKRQRAQGSADGGAFVPIALSAGRAACGAVDRLVVDATDVA